MAPSSDQRNAFPQVKLFSIFSFKRDTGMFFDHIRLLLRLFTFTLTSIATVSAEPGKHRLESRANGARNDAVIHCASAFGQPVRSACSNVLSQMVQVGQGHKWRKEYWMPPQLNASPSSHSNICGTHWTIGTRHFSTFTLIFS